MMCFQLMLNMTSNELKSFIMNKEVFAYLIRVVFREGMQFEAIS